MLLVQAVVFLYTMSCKEEFDAKGRRECAGLSERNRGGKYIREVFSLSTRIYKRQIVTRDLGNHL